MSLRKRRSEVWRYGFLIAFGWFYILSRVLCQEVKKTESIEACEMGSLSWFYDCWRWRGLGRGWHRLRLHWKRHATTLRFIFAASFMRTPRSNNWDALFVLAREIKLFCGLLTRLPELFSPCYSLISLHGSGANLQRGASRSLFLVGLAPAFCAFLLSLLVRLAGL